MSTADGIKGKSYLAASLDFMVRRDPKDLDVIKAYGRATGDARVSDYAVKEEARLRAAATATFAKVENDPVKVERSVEALAQAVMRAGPKTGFDLS